MRAAGIWIALLALVTIAVASGSARTVDSAALDLAQSVRAPPLDLLSSLITIAGQAEVTIAIALGLAVARLRRYPRAALIPLFIVATIAIEAALKLLVPEAPPPEDRVRSVHLLPFVASPFAYAFPSGHVARFAFLLRIADPIPAWVVGTGVVVMAITRLYLGEHWLSDTIGGAILGLGVADVARRLR